MEGNRRHAEIGLDGSLSSVFSIVRGKPLVAFNGVRLRLEDDKRLYNTNLSGIILKRFLVGVSSVFRALVVLMQLQPDY